MKNKTQVNTLLAVFQLL